MDVSVLIEPTAVGFRASTGSPLDVSAEATTEPDALAAVRSRVAAKLASGAKVVSVHVSDTEFLQAWDELADDPTFDQFQAACAAFRRQLDAADAADDGP